MERWEVEAAGLLFRGVARRAFVAVLVGVVTCLVPRAQAAQEEESPRGYAPAVADAASRALASRFGITREEALARLRSQDARIALGKSLVGRLGPVTAGFWLDQANDTVVVNVLDEAATDTVRQAGAVARLVSHSQEALASIHSRLAAFRIAQTAIGIDVAANQVVLTVSDAADDARLGTLLEEAGKQGPAVRVERTPGAFRLAVRAGDPIAPPPPFLGLCSAGFNVTGEGVLTAGHCTRDIANWASLGPSINADFPGNDYGRIHNDAGAPQPPTINLYNGNSQPVFGAADPTVGQAVCKSGTTTQLTCGEVNQLNVTVPYVINGVVEVVDGLARTNAAVLQGDSGGPLFAGGTALGITSGFGVEGSLFQPVLEALQDYDVELLLGPTVENVEVDPIDVYQGMPLVVTWSSTNQEAYEVRRCNVAGGPCTLILGAASTDQTATWNVPPTQPVGTFYLRVRVYFSGVFAEALSPEFNVFAGATLKFTAGAAQPGEGAGTVAPSVVIETSNGQNTTETVVVGLEYTGYTASSPHDFQPSGGSLTFVAGTPSGTAQAIPPVAIVQDALDEEDQELFKIKLVNPTSATLGHPFEHSVFIQDDDLPPSVSVSACAGSLPEGNTPCTFTIALSAPSGRAVGVTWATSGTATLHHDYSGGGTEAVSFAPGQTTRGVPLAVLDDPLDEFDETVVMTLSVPVNATIATGHTTLGILDDDPEPTVSISDCTITEATGQQVNCGFAITLSAPSGKPISVAWATSDGTATNGADYFGGSGTASFPPGATSVPVHVGVIGDAIDEFDETAFVTLSAPVNVVVADGQGQLTIVDDDAPPSMAISDCAIGEGDTAPVPCPFTVALSTVSGKPIVVSYFTAHGGGPHQATEALDYAPASGTLSFAPGTPTRLVPVNVLGDLLDEFDETYLVVLGGPLNATVADGQGLGTILDDDPEPLASVSDCSTAEGDVGYVACAVTATLDAPSGKPITLDLVSSDLSAEAGRDYAARTRSLSFALGDTSESASFLVRGDRIFEGPEAFRVDVQNAVNVGLADGQATAGIVDDDPAGFSMEDVGVVEGGKARFTVTLSPKANVPTSVDYGTADGTATVGDGDYLPTFGSINFAPGQATQTVDVPVLGGGGVEGVETLRLVLQDATGAPIAHPEATATIAEPYAGRSFDAGLTTDLLWRHGSSGDLAVWFMDDLVLMSGSPTDPTGVADLNWSVAGTGDFNGDGKADLLWHHQLSGQLAFWYMDGVKLEAGVLKPGVSDVSWRVVGTGDFDRDGMTDLLWRHSNSNELSIWYLDGADLRDGRLVEPTTGFPDLGWAVAGTGDFDRDGSVDVVWRHAAAGQLVVWYLDDATQTGGEFMDPSGLVDLQWQLRSTRDLDRDGRPDLLFRHSVSGELVGWLMDGIVLREGRYLTPASFPDLGWSIDGPR